MVSLESIESGMNELGVCPRVYLIIAFLMLERIYVEKIKVSPNLKCVCCSINHWANNATGRTTSSHKWSDETIEMFHFSHASSVYA